MKFTYTTYTKFTIINIIIYIITTVICETEIQNYSINDNLYSSLNRLEYLEDSYSSLNLKNTTLNNKQIIRQKEIDNYTKYNLKSGLNYFKISNKIENYAVRKLQDTQPTQTSILDVLTESIDEKYIDVPYLIIQKQEIWKAITDEKKLETLKNNTYLKYLSNPIPYTYKYGPNIDTFIVKITQNVLNINGQASKSTTKQDFDPPAYIKIPFYRLPLKSDANWKKENCTVFEYISDKRYWKRTTSAKIVSTIPGYVIRENVEKKNVFLEVSYLGEYGVSCNDSFSGYLFFERKFLFFVFLILGIIY